MLKNKNDAIGQRNHFLCYLRPCIVISKSSIGNLGSNKKIQPCKVWWPKGAHQQIMTDMVLFNV